MCPVSMCARHATSSVYANFPPGKGALVLRRERGDSDRGRQRGNRTIVSYFPLSGCQKTKNKQDPYSHVARVLIRSYFWKKSYSEYPVFLGTRIWFVFVYCNIRCTVVFKVPYSYNLYTVYGHGTHTVFV